MRKLTIFFSPPLSTDKTYKVLRNWYKPNGKFVPTSCSNAQVLQSNNIREPTSKPFFFFFWNKDLTNIQ